MYTFIHDAQEQVLYRMEPPKAEARRSGRSGIPTGWIVTAIVERTAATRISYLKCLATERLTFQSEEFPNPPTVSADIAIGKFLVRGKPQGDSITEAEYNHLRAQYEASFNVDS